MCDQQRSTTQPLELPSLAANVRHFDSAATLRRFEGDKSLVSKLVTIFLDNAPLLICQLKLAVADQKADDALRHVHHLKTLVGNFSDSISVALAEDLERQLQCGVKLQPESEPVQSLECSIGELLVELSCANEQPIGKGEPPSGG